MSEASNENAKVGHVYKAVVEVMGKLAKAGITKDRKNDNQGYKFRGIDDVYNALAPFMAEANLCIFPMAQERSREERQSKGGGTMFYVVVKMTYLFVSAVDGSKQEVSMYGEAMDSADKATNKAESAAYKYTALQTFCIPTEAESPDADATTPDVAPAKAPVKAKPAAKPAKAFADMSPPEQVYSLSRAAGLTSKEAVAKFCASILGREMVATKDGQQVPSIGSVTPDEAKVLCKELRAIAVTPSEGRAA